MGKRASSILLIIVLVCFAPAQASGQVSEESRRGLERTRAETAPVLELDGRQFASDVRPAYPIELIPKSDAALRLLVQRERSASKRSPNGMYDAVPHSVYMHEGEVWVDVLIRASTDVREVLTGISARNIVRAGDVFGAQIPLSGVEVLSRDPSVDFVELAARRPPLNRAGRIDIGADRVHAGTGLPARYRGEGVIVGVIDSGIDFSHPDFSDDNGSRIQYLFEYTQNGGHEWTKQQIDTNPVSVTQRDLDDGQGHGTHVVGTAAGGGRFVADYTGVAPAADIVFVKGFVGGGFSDVNVVGGCDYIFSKATALGKPAVINLSLGSNFGPIDGSSLYEQALSNLTGPGRIIVAAAGNEGYDQIHAGAHLPAQRRNVTLLLPDNPSYAAANLWYAPGVVSNVALGALYDDGSNLHFLGSTDLVPVGSFLNEVPITYEQLTLGYVRIDAQTTADPRNGDGNVLIEIAGDPENAIDLREVIWVIFYDSNSAGRADAWAFGGEFWSGVVGFDGVNEVTGNSHSTIGTPASAHRVISVGSYVTSNTWTDIDGVAHEWQNPDPLRDPDRNVVPSVGQRSFFSSQGPTRDGRTSPDISAPGELIFSSLSSHLTEGQGYQRALVLQGGRYAGQQGTSMASPHVAGVVALMLQADPTLDYDDVVDVLQKTARVDAWTGGVPNNFFGAGKIDAYEAVKLVAGSGLGPVEPTVLRHFDPESAQTLWTIDLALPLDSGFVFGPNMYFDRTKAAAFSLPAGMSSASVTSVRIWFGYKRANLTDESYSLVVLEGTPSGGPSGLPIATHEYLLRDVLSDDSFGTDKEPTVHSFAEPIPVGSDFFLGVDFGAYTASMVGSAAIMATPLLGRRVPEVWEQWSNGTWHNLSDAWHGMSSPGSGTDGWHLWIEVDLSTSVSASDPDAVLPLAFALEPNYPNPFNPSTIIPFTLPAPMDVELTVYDITGREITRLIDGVYSAGHHEVRFDGRGLSSGIYLVRLRAGSRVSSRTVVLLR